VWGSCKKCSYLSWTIVHIFFPKYWYYLYICQVLKDDDKREIYDQVIVIYLFNETKIVMLLE
jgi:outer membrane protein assembly factor BamE (lipoprotein component of BamABCDE complex)